MKKQSAPPCVVDVGLVVSKHDMIRVLEDLGRVAYMDIFDGQVQRCGEAYVMEVFSDASGATMIANRTIYLNVNSFDYLQLDWPEDGRPHFNLIQDGRTVRLIPSSDPLSERDSDLRTPSHVRRSLDSGLRSVVEEVLMESSCLCEEWEEEDDDEFDS